MCLRHLAAVQQDLTLSLAQIDAGGEEVDPAATPSLLAAAILQEDTSFAGDAAATADAVRRLLAQLVVALEEACLHHRSSRSDSPEALHARLRAAEDLGNLLRQSDTVLRADLATMSEDLDVAVGELGLRRNQVVALTLRLSSAAAPCGASRIGDAAPASSVAGAGAGASAEPSRAPLSAATEGVRRSKEQSGGAAASADAAAGGESAGAANGLVPSVVLATRLAAAEAENRELRQVTDGRAAELHQALEDRRKLEADAITAAATSRGPPSTSLVRGSALYQTMEATLQQLAVSQRSWNRERAAIVEDTASEAAATSRELTRVREWSSSLLDDLSRQLAEALKTAEAAALARDRLHTTYEAKKLDVAAGKPAPDSEAVLRQTLERHKTLETEVAQLKAKLEDCRKRCQSAEDRLASNVLGTNDEAVTALQKELVEERANSDGLIGEVESLSEALSEVEAQNYRLSTQLVEKEATLSKVMCERLKQRQQVISVKEENRTLQLKLKADEERQRALAVCLTASRKAASEARELAARTADETRAITKETDIRKRAAATAAEKARAAVAERDELRRTRDAAVARAEAAASSVHAGAFALRRAEEALSVAQARVASLEAAARQRERDREAREREEKAKEAAERSAAAARAAGADVDRDAAEADSWRDELLSELRARLNCPVVPSKPKEVVLLRCGHLFSHECVDELIASRSRKCPTCRMSFTQDDTLNVYF